MSWNRRCVKRLHAFVDLNASSRPFAPDLKIGADGLGSTRWLPWTTME